MYSVILPLGKQRRCGGAAISRSWFRALNEVTLISGSSYRRSWRTVNQALGVSIGPPCSCVGCCWSRVTGAFGEKSVVRKLLRLKVPDKFISTCRSGVGATVFCYAYPAAVTQWLRHCASELKDGGSTPTTAAAFHEDGGEK